MNHFQRRQQTYLLCLLLWSVANSCGPQIVTKTPPQGDIHLDKVIYGNDDRQELVETAPLGSIIHQQSKSVGALIYLEHLQAIDEQHYQLVGRSLEKKFGICPQERFAQQLSLAKCSGVIVAGKRFLTAGHCINANNCEYLRVVFDFQQSLLTPNHLVSRTSVLRLNCQEIKKTIINSSQDPNYGTDLAVLTFLEKDQKYLQHRPALPLELHKEQLPKGSWIYMLGHGQGLPLKLARGQITQNQQRAFYLTDLDAFAHNSGSPVFHQNSGSLIGILVAGELDYVKTPSGCLISRTCHNLDQCRGEKVTKIGQIADFLSE